MTDVRKSHKSHISSKRSRAQGWRQKIEPGTKNETRNQMKDYQLRNCDGCRFSVQALVGTGKPCCFFVGNLLTEPDVCLTRRPK
jgi:hypothetical protein